MLPRPIAPLSSGLSEPSCDIITKAQKLQDEAERSWALSQACAYYQHRCPAGDQEKESCMRIMGESCSARVLQCSLLNTMQNLEPATQTHVQGEDEDTVRCAFKADYPSPDTLQCFHFLIIGSSFFPSSSVWPKTVYGAEHHTATLSDRGWLSCPSRQLALAGQPAVGWGTDVRRGPGGQFLGGDCGSLFCRVRLSLFSSGIRFQNTSDLLLTSTAAVVRATGPRWWGILTSLRLTLMSSS